MASGYILLHRSLLDNWVWEERVFSKAEAWIDLIFLVNFAEGTHRIGNEILSVPPGSRYITIKELCERWKWSNTKVTNFLRLLQDDNMIVKNNVKKKTLITLVNWDKYQTKSDKKASEKRRENDEETLLNNKGKERNKENNIYSPEFETFWQNYPRREAKATAYKCWNARINQGELPDDMITGAKNYAASCRAKETEAKYIKLPATFIGPDKHYQDHLNSQSKKDIMAELGFDGCDVT